MPQWEYHIRQTCLQLTKQNNKGGRDVVGFGASALWTEKDAEGKTDYDKIVQDGLDEWELVSTTYIDVNPRYMVFVFKRPVQEAED